MFGMRDHGAGDPRRAVLARPEFVNPTSSTTDHMPRPDHDLRAINAGLRRLREWQIPMMIGAPDMGSRASTTGRLAAAFAATLLSLSL